MRALKTYLLLVGLPLGGLVLILRIGERLVAPEAVHGAYAVVSPAQPSPCWSDLLSGNDSSLTITQSGSHLVITLGTVRPVVLQGRLTAGVVDAHGVLESAQVTTGSGEAADPQAGRAGEGAGCAAGDTVRLTGVVLRLPAVKEINGTIQVATCRWCPPVTFRAHRPRGYPHTRRS
ncbi:MAG TPA: hypothetical protein VD793_06575 [Gemmatimonadales bacterium]|nr:hypothetical protein [Gemmatimonadales bacterium]